MDVISIQSDCTSSDMMVDDDEPQDCIAMIPFAEIYSPPRISIWCEKLGMRGCRSYDIDSGEDFCEPGARAAASAELQAGECRFWVAQIHALYFHLLRASRSTNAIHQLCKVSGMKECCICDFR